jgi:hypothetical protein
VSFGLVWACPTKSGRGPLGEAPQPPYKELAELGFRESRILVSKTIEWCSTMYHPSRDDAVVLSNIDCYEGSCVLQELLCCGLRRGDLHNIACWIRSASSGCVHHVIGRSSIWLNRCERSGQNSRVIGVILITHSLVPSCWHPYIFRPYFMCCGTVNLLPHIIVSNISKY